MDSHSRVPPEITIDNEEELENRCTCDEYDWEAHPCPFQQDINDDETPCHCCPHHTRECAHDI